MGTRSPRSRTGWGWRRGIVLLVLAVALLAGGAVPVASASPGPTLTLDELGARLADSGTIDGFMKTSMSGTTVSTIPVKILAVVDGFSWGKLIMFESTDPVITGIGGIAAGMSGSPIYVNVEGTDRLVGAVSYGDWFTLRGTGLATPIEYMTAMRDKYAGAGRPGASTTVELERPVVTAAGVVDELVLDPDPAATAASATAAVMHPLAVAKITGLSVGSTAYRKLAAKLEDSGLTVLPGETASAAVATPALEPGSPCGVVFSTGHYAISVLGTVTYVDGDDVLLFGHPILGGYSGYDLGIGPMEGTLTGATVDAVWPTTMEPYKMMTPADAKGVATQDRSAGVVAHLTGAASTFPVTTRASLDGGAPVTDLTDLGHWFATAYYPELSDSWGEGPGITTFVAAAGLYHGLDSDPLVGSATTTTTVVASDGSDDYTFTRDNVWDNNGDVSWMGLADVAASDVTTIMSRVLSDPYGVRQVTISSVDVTAEFSSSRKYAGITDVSIPRALRAGDNEVDVTYYRYGSADPQTLETTLTIPAGTSLSGYLTVMPALAWVGYASDYYFDESAAVPVSLGETQSVLAELPTNGDVTIAYTPRDSGDDSGEWTAAAETTVPTDRVFSGGIEKETAAVVLRKSPVADLGAPVRVAGYVERATEDVPVAVYCREAGAPEPAVPAATVTAVSRDGGAWFSTVIYPGFRHNVLITAEAPALSDDSLAGAAQRTVKVRARTALGVVKRSRRLALTARVTPRDAAGRVVFQRRANGRWLNVRTAAVRHGVARAAARAAGTSKVRARYTGGPENAASAWSVRRVP